MNYMWLLSVLINYIYAYNINRSFRIVGGKNAIQGGYPWEVSIQRIIGNSEREHFCGGAILNAYLVVTAAHCTQNMNLSSTVVVIGAWDLSANQTEYEIREIAKHESYDEFYLDNDIALLHIESKRERPWKTENIKIIKNPINDPDVECFISGYGRTKYDGENSPILKVGKVNVMDDSNCEKTIKEYSFKNQIQLTNVCAGGTDVDACQGDSGSPLVCTSRKGDHFGLLGLSSWGAGCASGVPGFYTYVHKFKDWIALHI